MLNISSSDLTRSFLLASGVALTALGVAGCAPTFDEGDVSTDCGATHPKVGYEGVLETHHHNVTGTVRVVDDCTIEISGFSYDGGGVDVRLVGATDTDYANGQILSDDLLGMTYDDETITFSLPVELTLDDVDHLSIWCTAAGVDFGSTRLKPVGG